MTTAWISGVLAVLAILSAGCSTPYKTPVFESRPAGHTDFSGIAQLVSQTPDRSIDVLIVHGMCTHDETWARATIAGLSKMLGGPEAPTVTPEPVTGTQTILFRSSISTTHGTVNASAIVWSPVVARLKSQLCYDQTNKSADCKAIVPNAPPYPYERANLNRALKDGLLNDCLADALIYQGKSRDAISQQLQHALLAASTPSGAKLAKPSVLSAASTASKPIVFISESLGSKVAFDAIYKLQNSADDAERLAGARVFDRFAQVFMGANQLPILALADQDIGGMKARSVSDYPADPLGALLGNRKSSPSLMATRPIQVVAFTDPNDLLSYALARSTSVMSFDVVDVIVSNDSTLFGFVERPDTAHTAYRENEVVTKLIACGSKGCL
jgi:hypothetical protein